MRFDALAYSLPIARWGLWELQAAIAVVGVVGAVTVWLGWPWTLLVAAPMPLVWAMAWFYRDPPRDTPNNAAAYFAPADGTVKAIERIDPDQPTAGPAIRIDIFLSVLDVHINRVPRAGVVQSVERQPGGYRNALDPRAVEANNAVLTSFRDGAGRAFAVRQSSGVIARRIVADVAAGDRVGAGQKYGMIKLGSRTELFVPGECEVCCAVGDRVRAGQTVLARAPLHES